MRSVARLLAITALAASWLVLPTTASAVTLLAVDDSASVVHDRVLSVSAPGVLANDAGVLGGTAHLRSSPLHGSVALASNGGYVYTPDSGYTGTDSFSYNVTSLDLLGLGLLTSNTATVTISVTNTPPVARQDSYAVTPGKTLSVAAPGVLGNDTDADGDSLTAAQVGGGVSGSLDFHPDGSFTYKPNGGFSGSESFTYRVSDGIASSNSVTVTLTTAAPTQTATPTPTPTPRPTPTPTPAPLVPLPSLPLPTLPLPTLSPSLPLPTLSPVLPTATPGSPMAAPTAQPSGSQAPSSMAPGSGGGDEPPAPGGGGVARGALVVPITADAAPSGLRLRTTAGTSETPLDIPLLGALGVGQLWWVPAATIGGPGLLVVLFVGLQLAGGLAWLPATWRFRRTGRRPPWRVTLNAHLQNPGTE